MTTATSFDLAKFSDDWGDNKREKLVMMARWAESAERYDDMCKCMKALVDLLQDDDLTIDERNLLSVAYKNVIGARRQSWRTLNAESQDEKQIELIQAYKKQVERELNDICQDILGLLESKLIKPEVADSIVVGEDKEIVTSPEGEAQVFYLKMSGDYYRYLAEAVPDQTNESKAAEFYKRAFELSEKVLEPTHPIRLGLALNYSVCFYEILKDKKKACELAKTAFDEAISKLDKLEENDYKDSTLIMQLLRDNLTLWTSTDDEDNNDDGDNDDGGD